jgi:AraC-like DNA-binding protein
VARGSARPLHRQGFVFAARVPVKLTIEELAKQVGVSRLSLPNARRLMAFHRCSTSPDGGCRSHQSFNSGNIKVVTSPEIGYASEAAFSRAFKKMGGCHPRPGVAAVIRAHTRCCEPSDRPPRTLEWRSLNRNLTHLTPLLIDVSSSSASEPAELIVSQN